MEWDQLVDVLVVGFGFAGGASAIAAHDAGAEVLVVEKMPHPGGISICSAGGVRIADDADAAFVYLKETNAGTSPDENLRVLADGMKAVSGFIRELASTVGATVTETAAPGNYPFPGFEHFGFVAISNVPDFDPAKAFPHVRGLRGGARLFHVVQQNVARRGISVETGVSVERLIQDASGRIVGAEMVRGATRRHVGVRRAVILACGGFEASPEMQAQYWQEKPVFPAAFRGNTGDGIRMAQQCGADLWHMWHYHGTYGIRHPQPDRYPFGIRLTRFPDWTPGVDQDGDVPAFFTAVGSEQMPWIIVDQDGRRYMNEYPPYPGDTGHRPMALFDPLKQRYPRIPSFLVIAAEAIQRHAIGFPTYNDPEARLEWSEDNTAEIANGFIKRAESLPELASAIGCSEAVLQETLTDWNARCRESRGDELGRRATTMMPIDGPPYYVAEAWPIVANTQGGPVHDERQRILRPDGRAIDGLYAAGEMGSVFGHLYLSGGNLAECFIGGRIAGREAADA